MTIESSEIDKSPILEVNKLSVSRSGKSIIEDVCLTINES